MERNCLDFLISAHRIGRCEGTGLGGGVYGRTDGWITDTFWPTHTLTLTFTLTQTKTKRKLANMVFMACSINSLLFSTLIVAFSSSRTQYTKKIEYPYLYLPCFGFWDYLVLVIRC